LEHPWFRNSWREAFAGQLESVIEAAKAWPNRSLLERSLWLEMAAQHDGIDRCANTFSQFDSTDTGSLTQAELVEALTWADLEEPEAKKAAAALDFNGDGKCEYFEFAAACLPMDGRRFEEMLWQEFRGLLDSVTLKPGEPPRVTLKPLLDRLMLPANATGPLTAPDQELSFEDFCGLFGLRVGSAGKDPFKRRNSKASNDSFGTGSTLTTGGAGDTESGSASSGNGTPTRLVEPLSPNSLVGPGVDNIKPEIPLSTKVPPSILLWQGCIGQTMQDKLRSSGFSPPRRLALPNGAVGYGGLRCENSRKS
jgi:hypothetical protein